MNIKSLILNYMCVYVLIKFFGNVQTSHFELILLVLNIFD
jgi:hypothetical protein